MQFHLKHPEIDLTRKAVMIPANSNTLALKRLHRIVEINSLCVDTALFPTCETCPQLCLQRWLGQADSCI